METIILQVGDKVEVDGRPGLVSRVTFDTNHGTASEVTLYPSVTIRDAVLAEHERFMCGGRRALSVSDQQGD